MAQDIKRHLSHLKSSGNTAPAAADLLFGEIAVGYGKGNEALYIKNNSGDVVTFTTAAGAEALAELYTDRHVISKVTGDSEITASLSDIADSGRTLTITHASGSAQSGFKKLASDAYGHITGGSNVALSDLTGLGAVSTARTITTASGLTGGGDLSANRTIGLVATGTAGTYGPTANVTGNEGNTIKVPQITTDAYGRVTTVTERTYTSKNTTYSAGTAAQLSAGTDTYNGLWSAKNLKDGMDALYQPKGSYVTTARTISTASGLTGGGNLSANLTIGHSNNITAGSAKTSSTSVTATPSGNNIAIPVIEYDAQGHVKSTGSTNVSLKVNNAATGTAGVVIVKETTGTTTGNTVMSQSAVTKAIEDSFAAQDAMVYKGLVGSGTNYGFPTTFSKGYTYKVATAFTADSVSYEIGDMFIANTDVTTAENYTKAHWDAIQTNLDPTLYVNTARTITATSGLTGGGNLSANRTIGLAATGTAGTYGPTADVTGSNNATIKVPQITTDAYGRVTAVTERTYTSVDHTYSVVTTSANGLAPKMTTTANTISTQASEFVLTTTSGGTPSWRKLPANAFKNTTYSAGTAAQLSAGTDTYDGLWSAKNLKDGMDALYQPKGSYVTTSRKVSAGEGLTGGGDLSADRTISHATAFSASGQTSPNTAQTPGFNATFDIPVVKYDKYGHITGSTTTTVKIPNSASTWANQNAFSNIKVGSTTVAAASTTDTVEFSGGTAINIVGTNGTAGNDKITFDLGDVICGDYA